MQISHFLADYALLLWIKKEEAPAITGKALPKVCVAYYIHFLMIKLQSAINQMSCHGRNIHGSNADMDYVLAAKAANRICAVIR